MSSLKSPYKIRNLQSNPSQSQEPAQTVRCTKTLIGSHADVYSVDFHPGENHVVSGGYDTHVRLFDTRNGEMVRNFLGHKAAVCSVVFNPYGNLIVSG